MSRVDVVLREVNSASREGHFKDFVLDRLAEVANVAQFASFGPSDSMSRFSRILGLPSNEALDVEIAVTHLLERSRDHSVNVRSFRPDRAQGNEFVYGISNAIDASSTVGRMKAEGMYTIVNETIDVLDGGVSGVSYGGIVEFTPGDTPRGVEKPGIVSLERGFALSILNQVYQFEPQLHYDLEYRVEFSLHPLRRGFRREHTVVWEIERLEALNICRTPTWPNNWSRFIGDKTFGLLIADGLGFSVPSTTVFPRRLPPFRFGRRTGSSETWLRTAPREPVPGRYTTSLGWQDPFRLLDSEDSAGEIASVLAQEGVDAQFAGASVASEAQQLVEGVSGIGDRFMLGEQGPERLPGIVSSSVAEVGRELVSRLGPVKFEWVRDNATTWIVQLHRLPKAFEDVLYAGEATDWHPFNVARGLEALRQLVNGIKGTGDGVVLEGDVGVTSHFGDLLRRARIPARLRSVPSPEA